VGDIWLRDLPTALKSLGNVTLFKGWETRSRSSGGYNKLMGIVVHHTASSTSTYNDTTYMWINSPTKPVGALYLARNGEVVIGAAGATNCAGRGGPYTTSKGTIAKDTANSNTISIEAGNAGTGEPWPKVQQDTYVALVAALCSHYKLDPSRDVMAHHEWAPDRKIDPAGSSRYAAGGNKWNMGVFRNDVKARQPQEDNELTEAEMDELVERTAQRTMNLVWSRVTTDPGVGDETTTLKILQRTSKNALTAAKE
jgi:N-acetyl-anhydromuramyl-L-alanine amidase AmpD